jgi:hypothetical protein
LRRRADAVVRDYKCIVVNSRIALEARDLERLCVANI